MNSPSVGANGAPQLITYVDRLGGDLAGLRRVLDGPMAGAFGGVHLLPFFDPIDGADAGFDPVDHATVDPRLGDWSGVAALAETHEVMADLIVNHVSADSAEFRDWVANGAASEFDGMFLTADAVFGGSPDPDEIAAIYRPRPGAPFTEMQIAGETRQVWTTFTANQVDLDVDHPAAWAYLIRVLDALASGGVTLVRLDAVGYAIKRRGTSCFMLPETFEFIGRLSDECRARGMTMLVEIHSYFETQIEIARQVDLVYDFALPPLVLHALHEADAEPLAAWLRRRPTNCVTVLDTHDGIGVVDVASEGDRPGLLPDAAVDALVESIHDASGGQSRQATGAAASNLDLYQVNCTFPAALGNDDAATVIARLIQLLVPGIPQVYYAGVLAAPNDMELLARTGVGRDINRPYFDEPGLEAEAERPVVADLLRLCRWRTEQSARFDGDFEVVGAADGVLTLRWTAEAGVTTARIDLAARTFALDLDGVVVTSIGELPLDARTERGVGA